jgi:2-oxoglutarate ferredoxin oxidoreductase subunit delta
VGDSIVKPSASKKPAFQGKVQIYREKCKGCGYCVEFCPKKALKLSENFNSKGYHPPELVDPARCTGCNLCGSICPDFAIHAWREEVEEE